MFKIEIICPKEVVSNVYGCIGSRRGNIDEEDHFEDIPLVSMKGFLPVAESFGFTTYLRERT